MRLSRRATRAKLAVGAFIFLCAVFVAIWYFKAAPSAPVFSNLEPNTAASKEPRRNQEAERLEAERLAPLKHDAEEDEQLKAVLSKPSRWTKLPSFVNTVQIDSSGRAWFVASSEGTTHAGTERLRASIERFVAGGAPLVHGGRLHLVDRAGRFWVSSLSERHLLQCFDGKVWSEPRLASGEQKLPDGVPSGEFYRGKFEPGGFEDSAGNVYFIGGALERTGVGVHRRSTTGDWSFYVYRPAKKQDALFSERPAFYEQGGGRVVVYPRGKEGGTLLDSCRVLRFDEGKWQIFDPRLCRNPYHHVRSIIPLPDGSIASICQGDRIWLYWPDGIPSALQGKVSELVEKLADLDPQVREKAAASLVAQGAQLAQALKKANTDELPEEARVRLADVMRTVAMFGEKDHTDPALYGGRFLFDQCYSVSRTPDGGSRFFIEHCTDRRIDKVFHESFAVLDTKGEWSVQPIPSQQWREVGAPEQSQDRFEDSTGSVWLRFGLRTMPDGTLSCAAPDGLAIDRALAEDRDGRVYVESNRNIFIFDPRIRQSPPKLPSTNCYGEGFVRASGCDQAWGFEPHAFPQAVLRYGPEGAKALPRPWDAGVCALIPLEQGVIVQLISRHPETEWVTDPVRLWDGKAWTAVADDIRSLVHQQATVVAKLAAGSMEKAGLWDADSVRIAADGKGGLWFWFQGVEGYGADQKNVSRLEYFDGSQWHDVWGDLGVSDGANHGRPLTAAKSGKALIIDSFQESCLYLVEYLDGHAHRTQLFTRANNYRSPTIRDFVQDQKGDVWLSPQIGDFRRGNMCCVHEGAMQDAGFRAIPLLADSAGRIWARAESEPLLRVMINGHWAEAMVQGADENTRVLETADQRLWVLTGDSIVQLKADSRDAFSEVGRWRWNAPLNDFTQAFCDDGEGLWIRGQANRATRYQLPVR